MVAFTSEAWGLAKQVAGRAFAAKPPTCCSCQQPVLEGQQYVRLKFPVWFYFDTVSQDAYERAVRAAKLKQSTLYGSEVIHDRCLHKPRSIFAE